MCVLFLYVSRETLIVRSDKMIEKYMQVAIKEAKKAYKNGDVPVGAVIVKNNKIIAKAYNKKQKHRLATHHAEIIAIEKACKKNKTWYLDDCEMYVTMEPCLMCAGAILQSRLKKIYYGVKNEKFGCIESIEHIFDNKKQNHRVIVAGGYCQVKIEKMLKDFFKQMRNNK